MAGIFDQRLLPPGLRGYVIADQLGQQRASNQLGQVSGLLGLQAQQRQQALEEQFAPMRLQLMQAQVAAAQAPKMERVDLGGSIGILNNGQLVGQIPKSASPEAMLTDTRTRELHEKPSGNAVLSEQGSMQRHLTPAAGALLSAQVQREGHGVTMRGQNLTNARALEAAARDRLGPPVEVTGPGGLPQLVVQNRTTGQLIDPNTMQPVLGVGPKVGEVAQKQQTGVQTTKDAIGEYRKALGSFSRTDFLNPNARARMGTIYNNMLLQAKEAYNLGVLNGPDYMILQSVITDPTSITGAVTSKKALDDQAAKLDEIMGRIGRRVTQTQTGVGAGASVTWEGPERRQPPPGFRVLGVEGK